MPRKALRLVKILVHNYCNLKQNIRQWCGSHRFDTHLDPTFTFDADSDPDLDPNGKSDPDRIKRCDSYLLTWVTWLMIFIGPGGSALKMLLASVASAHNVASV